MIALAALSLAGCSVVTDFFHEKFADASDGGSVNDAGDAALVPLATCGNGVVEAPLENCDPPNADAGCSTFCRTCATGERNFTDPATGHCYSFFGANPQSFAGGASACDALGGTLVTITDGLESASVGNVFPTGDTVAHIGLVANSAGVVTHWYNGEVVAYECWPNNCTMMQPSLLASTQCVFSQGGQWSAGDQSATAPYICEFSGWLYNPATHHAFLPLAATADCAAAESKCNALSSHLATITAGDADDTFLRQRHVVTETLTVNDDTGACHALTPASVDAGVAAYAGYLCEVK
jgi:hypothetical protein